MTVRMKNYVRPKKILPTACCFRRKENPRARDDVPQSTPKIMRSEFDLVEDASCAEDESAAAEDMPEDILSCDKLDDETGRNRARRWRHRTVAPKHGRMHQYDARQWSFGPGRGFVVVSIFPQLADENLRIGCSASL